MASSTPLPTNAPTSQFETSQNPTPFNDPAEGILRGEPNITDEDRASLWDLFHNSRDSNELAQKLQTILAPQDLKHALWTAKQQTGAGSSSQIEKMSEALQKLKDLDPAVLATAEKFPQIAKAFLDAAVKPPEALSSAAGVPAGKREAAGKGKEARVRAIRPRADGRSHLPPIPEAHLRILASDGGVHDIPEANIQQAQEIDPNLHILNP